MDILIRKIKSIQNKQQSLMWGHSMMSANEMMFAVGNKAYPKEPHYFTVTNTYVVNLLNDSHKRILYKECNDITEVAACVISLLKEWFPAKGIT